MGSRYTTAVWIRQPKELNMKRLLLVMGMVGCGIPVARLEDKGAKITKNEQGEIIEGSL